MVLIVRPNIQSSVHVQMSLTLKWVYPRPTLCHRTIRVSFRLLDNCRWRHKHARIYKNFEKGASYWNDWTDPHKQVCHAHLHFIEIMCSKDYLDDLNCVRILRHNISPTDQPLSHQLTNRPLTPVSPTKFIRCRV